MLVLYWTGTWWFRVNDERGKEGKRLIFPGLCSRVPHSRESAGNREGEGDGERERKREKERKEGRKKERHGDPSSDRAKVF